MEMIELLRQMVECGASDLHLTAGAPPQYRINGEIKAPKEEKPLTTSQTKELTYSILTRRQIEDFEKGKELDFSFGLAGVSRFRINLYLQRGGVALCARLVPRDIPNFQELGLPKSLEDFCLKNSGLFLVTGAVGSGKSTTLAAMIDYINNNRSTHVVTIEDPIEFLHKHKKSTIAQREVGTDTDSFAHALRRVFRQDPNIIMVGEMRDLETIHTSLTLAETGHLIFATLHTIDAMHTVSRIIDVFPPHQQQQVRVQLSMVLIGVMSQQLLPKKTGKGRVLSYELMNVIPSIRSLIRENSLPQIYSCIQTGRKHGMVTMNQSLAELYVKNAISWEEAMRRSTNSEEIVALIESQKNAGL